MRMKSVLTIFFYFFQQSRAIIIAVAGHKRQKCPLLKDEIYEKVLDFKEKQKCYMCDRLISYYSI